jgi:hypothetical protein
MTEGEHWEGITMPAMLMAPVSGETLEPVQLWDKLMIERGFLSSPSGIQDAYRTMPATLPDDMSGPGAPVGKGYETLAIIEILDKSERRVGPLGLGLFEGGGFDQHAEAEVLRILPANPEMHEGRMIVVVDTPVCPSCTNRLIAWAQTARLCIVDTYVPERQSMTSNRMVRPKTASRTATMAGRPQLHLRFASLAVHR